MKAGRLRLLALFGLAALAGCASLQAPLEDNLRSDSPAVRGCAQWFRALDAAVDEAGVRDAGYARIRGFPYLRADRLLASLRERAGSNAAAFQAYVDRLRDLDAESRRFELDNLPAQAVASLPAHGVPGSRTAAWRTTQECAGLLRELDMAKPALRANLLAAVQVPDEYSTAERALGFYPLTRAFFSRGVRRWEAETSSAFRSPPAPPRGASVVRYAPPIRTSLSRAAVAAVLDTARLDPLGFPTLSEQDFVRLAAAYAPSLQVAVAGDYDRLGALRWRRDSDVPSVDPADAVVYVHPAYARYGERILLQLVYTLWFSERPAREPGDLLSGALDGLVWRVTLAPDGEPVLYDSIHPCGCYHMFFPTPRAHARPAPDPSEEWAFVPASLPRVGEFDRPLVAIASGTHYIEGVTLVHGVDSVLRYGFRSYDELRSLRHGAERKSAFGPDGLIAGTERAERWLFWPMGIPSAGTMRQWGRHATAFVGHRHFDDADLIERRFDLDLEAPR